MASILQSPAKKITKSLENFTENDSKFENKNSWWERYLILMRFKDDSFKNHMQDRNSVVIKLINMSNDVKRLECGNCGTTINWVDSQNSHQNFLT